jgi:hypothetical protein
MKTLVLMTMLVIGSFAAAQNPQTTTQVGVPIFCFGAAGCSFGLTPSGSVNFQAGLHQAWLLGDHAWDYGLAEDFSVVLEGPGPLAGSTLYHVTGPFSGFDVTTNTQITGEVDYYVWSTVCGGKGGSRLCWHPVHDGGGITVTH